MKRWAYSVIYVAWMAMMKKIAVLRQGEGIARDTLGHGLKCLRLVRGSTRGIRIKETQEEDVVGDSKLRSAV